MEKKTKLTISGTAKKSIKNIEIAKTQGKNSVVIGKQSSKFTSRSGSTRTGSFKPKTTSELNRGTFLKPSFVTKSPSNTSDFERRKLAEQRATKRLKGDNDSKDKKTLKAGIKKRELKLTVSRALETVNFNSLFFIPAFKVFLSLLSLSPLSLFVALCSASFLRSKSLVLDGDFVTNEGFKNVPLFNSEVVFGLKLPVLVDPLLLVNLLDCFPITTEFFP